MTSPRSYSSIVVRHSAAYPDPQEPTPEGCAMLCPRCGHHNLPGVDQCGKCLCDLTALDRPAPLDAVERSLVSDTVATLKPRAPVVVPLGASVAQALNVLLDAEVGAVLVVDAAG